MPILKPQIVEALRLSGIHVEKPANTVIEELNNAGLSVREIFQQLELEMKNGETSSARVRSAELAMKAHKILQEEARTMPVINITIQDPNQPKGVNPILVPREVSLEHQQQQ